MLSAGGEATTAAPGPAPQPDGEDVAGRLCLAITSSTSVVGVAVGRAGAPAAEAVAHEVATDRRHAEELTPLVARTLADAGLTLDQIGCFAVDVGPGRFTGLRVGLATVRTLALVAARPVVALSSLEILAGAEPDRPLLAVVDARRGEVFQQRFGPDGADGAPVVGRPEAVAPGAAGAGQPVTVGDGADRYPEWYGAGLVPGREPSAAVMVTLAGRRLALPGHLVAPVYLRDPDVHINVTTRHTPR
ncbi:MAG: tRNA (adenosine(37)-N6)-threonylcarbamoyltransferase complex dimerization subunit type 1 TsaB [Acidimicrobiales bacterium]